MRVSFASVVVAVASVFAFVTGTACASDEFRDEFTGNSPNTARWDLVQGPGGISKAGVPPPMVFNLASGVTVSGGAAHMRLDRQEMRGKTGVVYPFVSARMQTRHTFLYGQFEVRAQLPQGRGIWPGLWLRTPFGPPINGEIDLVEGFGSDPAVLQSTLHTWKNGSETHIYCSRLFVRPQSMFDKFAHSSCKNAERKSSTDFANGYHVYGLDWRPESVTWLFDGRPYFTMRKEIPSAPMVFVMNILLRKDWDGGPDDSTKLPQFLDVDYFRYRPLPR
jgi:beta-glucanase (GH16 family)